MYNTNNNWFVIYMSNSQTEPFWRSIKKGCGRWGLALNLIICSIRLDNNAQSFLLETKSIDSMDSYAVNGSVKRASFEPTMSIQT